MKKLENKKGFTLAELLIVVAIIAVLVAVSIPIFTAQLKKSRLATNQANARSAKAAALVEYLDDSDKNNGEYVVKEGKYTAAGSKSTSKGDITPPSIEDWTVDTVAASSTMGEKVFDTWTVYIADDGTVTYTAG